MNHLLPDILNQAADRIAARRGPVRTLARPVPVPEPPDDEAVLASLVLHEAALKLAYTGHCGRPGKRGGSRPKNQCGALPFGAASPNAYTVERSVERKRGKPEERITRVIYEKRLNPEDRKEFWRDIGRDAGADVLKWVAVGVPTAAALALLAGNVGVNLRGPGGASDNVSMDAERIKALGRRLKFWKKKAADVTPDVTPPATSEQGSPPIPKPGPLTGKGKQNGAPTANRSIKKAPTGAPLTAHRSRSRRSLP